MSSESKRFDFMATEPFAFDDFQLAVLHMRRCKFIRPAPSDTNYPQLIKCSGPHDLQRRFFVAPNTDCGKLLDCACKCMIFVSQFELNEISLFQILTSEG